MNCPSFHFEEGLIVLDEPLYFEFKGERRIVPKGFVSDGASVPRFLWRFLSPAYDPATLAPSVVHDYLYWLAIDERKDVDQWYRDALKENGYPAWKATLTYWGVRIGGGRHWGDAL